MTVFMIYSIVGLCVIFIFNCLIAIIEELELEVPDPIDSIINEDWINKCAAILFIAISWPLVFLFVLLFGLLFIIMILSKKLVKFFIKTKKGN